jgi:hypothetical protein
LVLTIDGKAYLVVQDADAYQAFLDRVEAIERIQRGLADVKAGRTKPFRYLVGCARSMAYRVEIPKNAEAIPKSCISGFVARAPQLRCQRFKDLERAVLSSAPELVHVRRGARRAATLKS